MKKIALLLTFSAIFIYGQAQIISTTVFEKDHYTGVYQVKLYTSPFRDAWPGLTFSDPEVPTSVSSRCSHITEHDTIILLSIFDFQVTLWKNGELIDISGDEFGVGTALFVHENDIYVLWNKRALSPPHYSAHIWKNGETYCEIKNQDWTYVDAMSIIDSNLYVVGQSGIQGKYYATLWVNGVAQFLSDTLYGSAAISIAVSDSNVYIVGYGANFQGKDVAKLWINGVETNLTTGEQHAQAYSVCVDGEDVYVVGQENVGFIPKPVFWKNGVKHQLSTQEGFARCIRVFEGDVYIGGRLNDVATIWKNGMEIEEFTNLYSIGTALGLFIFPDSTSEVNDFEQPLFNAALYPNPATHHVTIDLPSDIPSAQFSLFDMYGRLLLQKQVQNGEKVNLPNLSSGVYLYQVDSEKGRATGKVVVDGK